MDVERRGLRLEHHQQREAPAAKAGVLRRAAHRLLRFLIPDGCRSKREKVALVSGEREGRMPRTNEDKPRHEEKKEHNDDRSARRGR